MITTHFIKGDNVLREEIIGLKPFETGRPALPGLRRIVVCLEVRLEEGVILTNNFDLAASTIAAICRQRWQIQLCLKLLKEQLRIKTFVGTTADAVRIQMGRALGAVLIVRAVQFRSSFRWAAGNLVALVPWNRFSYRNLREWIDRPVDTPAGPVVQLELSWGSLRFAVWPTAF